jgi:hypothetical protein
MASTRARPLFASGSSAAGVVRHHHQFHLGGGLEQLRSEVIRRAEAGCTHGDLAGLSLGQRDQFLDRFRRNRRVDCQH